MEKLTLGFVRPQHGSNVHGKVGFTGAQSPPQGWALLPAGPEAPADPSRKGQKWSPSGSLETSLLTCVTLRRDGVAHISQPPHPARKLVLESVTALVPLRALNYLRKTCSVCEPLNSSGNM